MCTYLSSIGCLCVLRLGVRERVREETRRAQKIYNKHTFVQTHKPNPDGYSKAFLPATRPNSNPASASRFARFNVPPICFSRSKCLVKNSCACKFASASPRVVIIADAAGTKLSRQRSSASRAMSSNIVGYLKKYIRWYEFWKDMD